MSTSTTQGRVPRAASRSAAVGKIDKSALSTITMKGVRETANGAKSELEISRKDGKMRSSTTQATVVLAPAGSWVSSKQTGTREMSAEQREQLEEQTRRQHSWLLTQIKHRSAHTLVVPF